ncbi:hypothetical protein BKD09_44600 [Bradyrhizobium japonicum]|uniref:Uncharacterized protein n=1 Tax=Bradyrhizobium japonicum TaxID=375 RepID=A0A1L3FQ13_BRAJP|nr:hypothetical protein BKD09_44600 [Bradyrhizobium japonicum]BCA01540.1 hypothetical protein H12S4_24440 [Bradyrhizobium diazoefficiens]BCA18908.1 hypothetical protein BDHH15_21230 [Bradyrhizobium diazoefficiens]
MRYRVEVFRQIGVNNICVAPAHKPVHFLDGIDRVAARAISISSVLKIRLEDRFQHDLCSSLDDPVPDCWDTERTFAAAGLRDHHPPHRIGPIGLRDEFIAQASQPCFESRRVDLFESYSVHSRRTRVGAGQLVGMAQNVLAADLVVQHVEAEGRLRLRLTIKLSFSEGS